MISHIGNILAHHLLFLCQSQGASDIRGVDSHASASQKMASSITCITRNPLLTYSRQVDFFFFFFSPF
ncbi:hypothetical protein GDO81_012978 [Engystomops pustulosus]|uniref:Uncharacterized protein n=1 Tax=Engystomops pustulosus TaxID=76066 RepID=A0AAV7AX96_ENGPU|nr:hypothetical protein GDO81_012978 [Engystomops pustulosus]